MEEMVKVTIDGVQVSVPKDSTILEASKIANVNIPTLCYLKNVNQIGACRVCLVEVEGMRNLVASCVYPVSDGMVVKTNTDRVIKSRKCTLELLLSDHNQNCLSCERSMNCELQALAKKYNCDSKKYAGAKSKGNVVIDDSSPSYIRDNSKCISCRRCVSVCALKQAVGVIGVNGRGFESYIGTCYDKPIGQSTCINCGQCLINCPTGALHDKSQEDAVLKAISDSTKRTVVAMAPSTRVALGEYFGMPMGTNVEKKMVTALKNIGFDDVFDINFAADLTIMEEAAEFVERLKSNQKFPMFTSCCPAWVKFVEQFYPQFIPNLSTCKSPQGMFGAVMKSYYAKKLGIKPEDLIVVSIMPCTAKKYEKLRPELYGETDIVLTARELGHLIDMKGMNFANLPESEFDNPFGLSSGAGVIFGASGGVMEAALRTVADTLEGKSLEKVDYLLARGLSGTKEAEIEVAGKKVRIAIVSGLVNAKNLLEKVISGEKQYDFVEVMTCPGGCSNGGGMPIHPNVGKQFMSEKRANSLYQSDLNNECRKSHENPSIKLIYKEFFKKPNSEIAHKILHTSYSQKSKF